MRVRFLQDHLHETEGRNRGIQFEAGKVYDLRDDDGQRWVSQGLAERVDAELQPVSIESGDNQPVDIPDDWDQAHHMARIALAKKLAPDAQIDSAEAANGIIQSEVERRDAVGQG